jgi:hypothetical protein
LAKENETADRRWPIWADLPWPETRFKQGSPIVTALVGRGASMADVARNLRAKADEVHARIVPDH